MGSQTLIFTQEGLRAALSPSAILSLLGIWVGYRILLALYNISPFHPLYQFPGPKRAALSYVYEGYYDWWLDGRYGHQIRAMHERYGPIVRINPDELHCFDPYFVDEIYAGPGRIRDKWVHMLNAGSIGPFAVASLSTVPHDLHRSRRAPLAKFFSRKQMLKLEDEVNDFAQQVVDKMLRSAGKGPFNVKEAFNCFTADVISQYAFGEPMGFIAQEGWEPNFATWVSSFLRSVYMMRHNSVARMLAHAIPFLSDYMGEDIKMTMRQMNVVIPRYIKAALENPSQGRVFADLVESNVLPESEKTLYRLSGEGFTFLIAGTETTASVLTALTYHLLANPAIYARLMEDLEGFDPSNLKWNELEQLPYFWAIMQESLRMMPGVSQRSARIPRGEDLYYKSQDGKTQWVIPRGTPIGMTSMFQHWNQELFPEPDKFNPMRWLENGKPNLRLSRMLIAFGKGTRVCLGENLATCELYIMGALMAMRVLPRTRLHNTTLEDLTYEYDRIVPYAKNGSVATHIKIE